MTDGPDFFEVQSRRIFAASWETVSESLAYDDALAERDRRQVPNRFPVFRVQPFGTGPNDVEPPEDAPAAQRAAWTVMVRRVEKEGGNPLDIYRHADSYRWRAPAAHPTDGGRTVVMGWSAPATAKCC